MTGVYAFVILFHMTFYRWLKNGPSLNWYIPEVVEVCRNTWWKNVLYVTNFEFSYMEPTLIPVTCSFTLKIIQLEDRVKGKARDGVHTLSYK